MHAKLFLTTALTASVSAAVIEERDLKACASAASKITPLLTQVPTPDPTLARFIGNQEMTITDSCMVPAITGSLASEATSYYSTLSKFYNEHKKDFENFIKACDDVDEVKDELQGVTLCSSISWASSTGGASSDDKKDNSATHQSGMAVAAAVVACIAVFVLN